jgi:hypothetical protein
MYIVTIQNGDIYTEIHNDKEKLLTGNVVKGINAIDSFTFTILPSNIGFNLLKDFKTMVTVFNTNRNRYEFIGRVLYSSAEMTSGGLISKAVTCENLFGYLCDSVQSYVEEQNWTVKGLLQKMIDVHNSLVETEKRFTLGTVTVEDPNDNLYCGIQRESTWKMIEDKLINVLGGEIQYRVEGSRIYLDYLKQIGEVKTTEIALSKNMKAITRERDPSEYITRLIPLGAKLYEDSEERLDISSVNNGVKYIDDEAAIAEYGIHVGYVEWDEVTLPENLLANGQAWLKENGRVPVKYSIDALDLSLLGLDIDDFNVGNTHPITNALLGIDDTARIIKKNIDICDEVKSTIEVGEKFKTLIEIQQDQKKEQAAATKLIKVVSSDYISKSDNDRVVQMVNLSSATVQVSGNRLIVNSDKFGLSADGTLTAKDAHIGTSLDEYSVDIGDGIITIDSPIEFINDGGDQKALLMRFTTPLGQYGLYAKLVYGVVEPDTDNPEYIYSLSGFIIEPVE